MSTGEGKTKESEIRTTVFKRDINRNYNLKSKASRVFFNDVLTRFPALGFSTRAFNDEIVYYFNYRLQKSGSRNALKMNF